MATTGERLARVQYQGHLAIDALSLPVSRQIDALILRYAIPGSDGIARIQLGSRPAILSEIGAMLDRLRPELHVAIMTAVQAAEVAAADGEPIPDVAAFAAASGETWRTLGTDRSGVIAQSGALLASGIAGKLAAREVAKRVSDYFNPWFSNRRDAGGVMRREGREGAVKSWPGKSGLASAPSRATMLWQTTAAHGRQSVLIARREGRLLRYRVSHQHLEIDECSLLERRDVGFGIGLYPPDEFPSVPRHRFCRCWAEPAEREPFRAKAETAA